MIPVYGTRQPDGLHVAVEFEAPIPPGTAEAMTQAAADSLAARVRAHPEPVLLAPPPLDKDLPRRGRN